DFVLETLIPIDLPRDPWRAGLRFGARYPTTDARVGLGRDQTDVHLAAMAGYMATALNGYLELGVGINGSRSQALPQQDVLIYAGSLSYGGSAARARIEVVGHAFWLNEWSARGNENRGEVRVGGRIGRRVWAELDLILGFEELGPTRGVRVRVGRSWPGG
ncbi:MAG TPA: hypothetical protein VMN39_01380, partial [Longimicrobiaceae bacterium]|nr:hypothetical protein [Longimicrobiaceae bacterium]